MPKKKPFKVDCKPRNIVLKDDKELNEIIELTEKKNLNKLENKRLMELQKKHIDTKYYKDKFIVFF